MPLFTKKGDLYRKTAVLLEKTLASEVSQLTYQPKESSYLEFSATGVTSSGNITFEGESIPITEDGFKTSAQAYEAVGSVSCTFGGYLEIRSIDSDGSPKVQEVVYLRDIPFSVFRKRSTEGVIVPGLEGSNYFQVVFPITEEKIKKEDLLKTEVETFRIVEGLHLIKSFGGHNSHYQGGVELLE